MESDPDTRLEISDNMDLEEKRSVMKVYVRCHLSDVSSVAVGSNFL